jgi:hypothetical protein
MAQEMRKNFYSHFLAKNLKLFPAIKFSAIASILCNRPVKLTLDSGNLPPLTAQQRAELDAIGYYD